MERKAPKQNKAESITVRLDPKIRFGLDLLARKQRRTLSSVVEWALQKTIDSPESGLYETGKDGNQHHLYLALWDVEEADRLYNLATFKGEWLTYEEEILAKVIRESEYFQYLDELLKDQFKEDINKNNWLTYHSAMRSSLREYYVLYKKVAEGVSPKDSLPKPPRNRKSQTKSKISGEKQ